MPWPLSQDYNEAVQNPALSFRDPELCHGEVTTNALGLPVPCSGNFADVYQVRNATGTWAVKCFTREIPGLRERYTAISDYLRQAQLPFLVAFQYLDPGIRAGGQWYPVVKMDWVEGVALNRFVEQHLDQPPVLDRLARLWVSLARLLREARLAHGDLQHGNVLLVPGSKAGSLAVKLVDYDGMWVPVPALRQSIEVGHPAYQHPQRLREVVYGEEVDRFSHLVIYTALRALLVGGKSLWDRYDNGDNLLFQQADFAAPTRSPLFAELLRMKHPEVYALAAALIDASRRPQDQTPLLEDLAPSRPGSQTLPAAEPEGRSTALPAAKTASSVVRATNDNAGTYQPAKGRGMLIGAVALFLCSLGLGLLIFWGYGQVRADLDGALLRDPQRGEVYLVQYGVLRHVPDHQTLKQLFGEQPQIRVTTEVRTIRLGRPIANGAYLARVPGTAAVYLVEYGTRCHVSSPEVLHRYRFYGHIVERTDIDLIPRAASITLKGPGPR
jgi:hypothetical protein